MFQRPIPNTITGPIEFKDEKRSSLRLELIETIQGNSHGIAVWDSSDPDRVSMMRSEKDQQDLIDLYIKNTTFIVSSKYIVNLRVTNGFENLFSFFYRIGEPYLMPKTSKDPNEKLEGNDALEGYAMDVIDSIAKMLKFSYKFVLTEGNKHGSYNKEKKSWDGLIKDILDRVRKFFKDFSLTQSFYQQQKAHLAICDLTITEERRSAVDFSLPFMTLGKNVDLFAFSSF